MFFISISFVNGFAVREEAPLCGCTIVNFQVLDPGYDYCIIDSPCTQFFELTEPLGSHVLTSGGTPLGAGGLEYIFNAPDSCTTPGGCIFPFHLNANDESVTVTMPANTYINEYGFLGWSGGCGGGGCGEMVGVAWYNINPFGVMYPSQYECSADEDCLIRISASNRLFHGPVAVRGAQQSSGSSFNLERGSISVGDDGEGRGYIDFVIPAYTFGPGEVDLEIYDLIDTIPISGQTGGYTTLTFTAPLQIDVIQNNCLLSEPCDLDIYVLNVPIDIYNQHFEISGQYGDMLFDLTDPEVSVYTNHVEYTIPAYLFEEEQITVLYWDSLLSQQDADVVNMISSSGPCIPDNCNGICPTGCTIGDDPDCGCVDDNTCCGLGCTITNDNDCSAVCIPDGCNGICPSGCSVADDFDCGCVDDNTCCGLGCTITNDNDCSSIPPNCGTNDALDEGEGEECDIDSSSGDFIFPIGVEDCGDIEGWDSGPLGCNADCTYDFGSCVDDGSGSGSGSDPVIGPNEYLVNGGCVDDGDEDKYGVKNWILYNGFGVQIGSGSTECVLDIEEIPMFSFWSVLLFFIILFIFYSNEKIYK